MSPADKFLTTQIWFLVLLIWNVFCKASCKNVQISASSFILCFQLWYKDVHLFLICMFSTSHSILAGGLRLSSETLKLIKSWFIICAFIVPGFSCLQITEGESCKGQNVWKISHVPQRSTETPDCVFKCLLKLLLLLNMSFTYGDGWCRGWGLEYILKKKKLLYGNGFSSWSHLLWFYPNCKYLTVFMISVQGRKETYRSKVIFKDHSDET